MQFANKMFHGAYHKSTFIIIITDKVTFQGQFPVLVKQIEIAYYAFLYIHRPASLRNTKKLIPQPKPVVRSLYWLQPKFMSQNLLGNPDLQISYDMWQ